MMLSLCQFIEDRRLEHTYTYPRTIIHARIHLDRHSISQSHMRTATNEQLMGNIHGYWVCVSRNMLYVVRSRQLTFSLSLHAHVQLK